MREDVRKWLRWTLRAAVVAVFAAGVVTLLLYLAGRFAPKVPEAPPEGGAKGARPAGELVPVRLLRLPRTESAVGTIRAVHETTVASKLLARVVEINLKAGQQVQAGDVLVRLDVADLQARLQQAKAALTTAETHRAQAVTDEGRLAPLLKEGIVSRDEYDKAMTQLKAATSEVERAREAMNEVQVMVDWATVRAPMAGQVVDKKVDLGDTVTPGQPLATLFDPSRMQLVANVRESLAQHLQVGQEIGVQVDVLKKLCRGMVSEIVPQAQADSRSFQVKVTGPCPAGIYSGMFGRIMIPLEEEQLLAIPATAVRQVGQLELVDAVGADGQPARRAIRTGRIVGDAVEVLSGLRVGEQVVVPGAAGEKQHE